MNTPRPLKIGVVCYPTQGGSGVVATGIAHAMAERGHSVHVISYATPFRFQSYMENLHFHEVEVSAYPLFRYPPYDLALANKIMEVVEEEGLDIVHAHYAVPHSISALLAQTLLNKSCTDFSLVTTLHGTDVTIVGQERGYKRITKYGIEHSNAVTAVSEDLARETARLFEVSKDAIKVIPNFVDSTRFTPSCCPERRAQLGLPDEKLIIHVSNLREVKRPLDCVEVLAKVRQKGVNARLLIMGEGPLARDCKNLAHRLGVEQHIRFLGSLDTPWEFLPQADVFLLPSEHESFGLAALEAMACGVPVVASNAGGIPEVIVEGVTGYMCDVGDVDAFADRVARVLEDQEHRDTLSRAARKHAVDVFGMERITDDWEAFYVETMSRGSNSSPSLRSA